MSDWASIFVRYHIQENDRQTGEKKSYEGIFGNHYKGYDPLGMVTRAKCGLLHFVENAARVKYIYGPLAQNHAYQTFRRMFDVDFVRFGMDVSLDAAQMAKEKFMGGSVPKDELADKFFWCDTDFGVLLIDIYGSVENVNDIRYAYIRSYVDVEEILDVDGYIQKYHDFLRDQTLELANEAADFFREKARLMTAEEVKDFFVFPLYEYLFSYELEQEKKEAEKRERLERIRAKLRPDLAIEELELPELTTEVLKKAGIDTAGRLKEVMDGKADNYKAFLKWWCNVSDSKRYMKYSYDKICEILTLLA